MANLSDFDGCRADKNTSTRNFFGENWVEAEAGIGANLFGQLVKFRLITCFQFECHQDSSGLIVY